MANFKRKRCKRQVRCTICTTHRWKGNGASRHSEKGKRTRERQRKELSEEARC